MRSIALLAALGILAVAGPARADEHSYKDRDGKRRVKHLVGAAIGGAVYAASETILKTTLAPSECRICKPTNYDESIRNDLKWSDTRRASSLSNLGGFVIAPLVGLGWLAIASDDHSYERWIDDVIPVIETAVVAGLLNQVVKFAAGEQRPFVHFAPPGRTPDDDDNVSFYSGHTTLGFAIATSAGEVARRRGYRLAPAIYATGYLLAGATGYLRIAADKHYFTDVAVGAVTGVAIGLAVPMFHHEISIVPARGGLAIAGRF